MDSEPPKRSLERTERGLDRGKALSVPDDAVIAARERSQRRNDGGQSRGGCARKVGFVGEPERPQQRSRRPA